MVNWERRRELIAEYEAAQRSAEHFDRLLWTVPTIFWGANMVLLGFALDKVFDPVFVRIVVPLGVVGIVLVWVVVCFMFSFNRLMGIKYDRCKELEKLLGFRQHLNTEKAHPENQQKKMTVFVAGILTVAWSLIVGLSLWTAFHPPLTHPPPIEPCIISPPPDPGAR